MTIVADKYRKRFPVAVLGAGSGTLLLWIFVSTLYSVKTKPLPDTTFAKVSTFFLYLAIIFTGSLVAAAFIYIIQFLRLRNRSEAEGQSPARTGKRSGLIFNPYFRLIFAAVFSTFLTAISVFMPEQIKAAVWIAAMVCWICTGCLYWLLPGDETSEGEPGRRNMAFARSVRAAGEREGSGAGKDSGESPEPENDLLN